MIVYIALGMILAGAFCCVEIVVLIERASWRGDTPPCNRPGWWATSMATAYALVAATGMVLLLWKTPRALDRVDWLLLLNFALAPVSIAWADDRRIATRRTGHWLALGFAALAIGQVSTFDECVVLVAAGCTLFLAIGVGHQVYEWLWGHGRPKWSRRIGYSLLLGAVAFCVARAGRVPDANLAGIIGCAVFLSAGVVHELSLRRNRLGTGLRLFGFQCNYQAVQCVLLILASVHLYRSGYLPPDALVVLLALSGLILIATRSRTVPWAFGSAAALWLYRSGDPSVRLWLGISFFLLVVVLGPLLLLRRTRQATWSFLMLGRAGADLRSLNKRTGMWAYAWEAVRRRPLFGFGFGSFWNDTHRAELHRRHPMVIPARDAHSMYLELLLNGGVLSLLLFLGTLGSVAHDAAKTETAAGSLIIALIVFSVIRGVAESAISLPSYRTFSLVLLMVAMQ